MMSGIYKLTFPNNKIYIGQSVNIEHRLNQHRLEANKCFALVKTARLRNITKLRGVYRKYPWDQINVEILEYCKREEMNEREIHYITLYDSFNNGLNGTTGGNQGFTRSKETLAKMRFINLGKYGGDQSIPFFINDVRYVSILAASVALNIPSKTIHNRLNSRNEKYFMYLYEDITKVPVRRKAWQRGMYIKINGIIYDSISEASATLNEYQTTLLRRARSTSKKFINYELIILPSAL